MIYNIYIFSYKLIYMGRQHQKRFKPQVANIFSGFGRLMRSSFLAEASDCIRSLQAVFDSANTSTFASRFDQWRKIDLKATAQMQQHVKTLQHLNDTISDFLQKRSAVEVFQDFHQTMADLTKSVREMQDFREHFTSSIDSISSGIAERVLSTLSKEAEERSAWVHCQLERQGEVQDGLAATQRKIWHRLESMGRSLEQQLKATKEQTDQLDSLSASHMSVKKDCKSLLDLQQGVYTTFQNSSEQQGALQDNIFATISKEMQSMNGTLLNKFLLRFSQVGVLVFFKKDPTSAVILWYTGLSLSEYLRTYQFFMLRWLSGYLLESLGWTPATPPVTESLQSLETRFIQLESKTLQEMAEQRTEVDRMERALRESEDNITRANQLREDGVDFFVMSDVRLVARSGAVCNRMRI